MVKRAGTIEEARAAKAEVAKLCARAANVNGIGLTRTADGRLAVKVNLTTPEHRLPDQIGGIPIVIEIAGSISKRNP